MPEYSAAELEPPPIPAAEPNNEEPSQAPTEPGTGSTLTQVIKKGDEAEIKASVRSKLADLVAIGKDELDDWCALCLYDPSSEIGTFESDHIYEALTASNGDKKKNVLLVLTSPGGSIEPAYQISKLCKAFSPEKFVVVVPRQAKSAATLVCLGADEIHIGPLGQLGPIDPQFRGLPALGVSQALKTIASLCNTYPASAEMFASYLKDKLNISQIGYFERVCESAAQYAERLLGMKAFMMPAAAEAIAHKLVYDYKDHGFVIDLEEARKILGESWIKSDTTFLLFADVLYRLLDTTSFLLSSHHEKAIEVIGSLHNPDIFIYKSGA